ncbi:MAG: glycosyltransferase involved in cell wall biosynthesis [Candidatus Paceibacteria bacterium]|jgi:glycosyltransferase involved in cell wall biosynthesis
MYYSGDMKISIVLPIYNEAESIPELMKSIEDALREVTEEYEIIAVNDSSTDATAQVLVKTAEMQKRLKVINFRTNQGQTSALHAGIENASGEIIIPMDADLENDPKDIGKLIQKLEEGFDVVSGWRKNRWGNQRVLRKLPSIMANRLISSIAGLKLHDYGCTLKAYRHEVIKDIRLYGEMHRFIPAYAANLGAKVTEMEVNYQPRKYGTSKYGFSRTSRVLLDLLILRFMHRYMDRPIQFFGKIGLIVLLFGFASGFASIYLKLFHDISIIVTPLPTFAAMCLVVSVQLVTMGVVAEMVMRTYYESQDKRTYLIKDTVNF